MRLFKIILFINNYTKVLIPIFENDIYEQYIFVKELTQTYDYSSRICYVFYHAPLIQDLFVLEV